MVKKEGKLNWFLGKFRHGLILYGITNRLSRIGIEIRPYYWEKEYVTACDIPKIKGNPSEYYIKYFGPDEIKFICSNNLGYGLNEKLEKLKNGQLCMGLMHKDNIAAYSWIELNKLNFRDNNFKLKENESYLGGMFTVDSYRGRNLATFLRYKTYKTLKEKGRDTFFSISDYFNYPAIKFKKKLNSEHIKLYLYIELFKKYHWSFVLRNYK